jgi:hypothetical protein
LGPDRRAITDLNVIDHSHLAGERDVPADPRAAGDPG